MNPPLTMTERQLIADTLIAIAKTEKAAACVCIPWNGRMLAVVGLELSPGEVSVGLTTTKFEAISNAVMPLGYAIVGTRIEPIKQVVPRWYATMVLAGPGEWDDDALPIPGTRTDKDN